MGNFRVLDALTTLAFDYPDPDKPERAAMFRGQLGDFLTLVMQGKLDLETRGSYAGAIGMPQFMPGSIMRYAVDGDDSGHIDLTNSTRTPSCRWAASWPSTAGSAACPCSRR